MTTTTSGARRRRSRRIPDPAQMAGMSDDGGGAATWAVADEHPPVLIAESVSDGGERGGIEAFSDGCEKNCLPTPRHPERWWRQVPLYDPADVGRAIGAMLGNAPHLLDDGFDMPFEGGPEETSRLRTLRAMRDDLRGGLREAILGSDAMAARVAALRAAAPHFDDYLALVERAVIFSALTLTPLAMPPVLLVGSPGIGKTHLLRRLAGAIGCASTALDMTQTDSFRLHGQNTCWRNARVGVVAAAMLEGETVQRFFTLDEFDKPVLHGWAQRPHDVFHQLLEPENAASFVDEFLEVPLHLEHAFWVASANATDDIPASILDRMLVLHVPHPGPAHIQAIVDAIYAETCRLHGGMFEPKLSVEVRQALAGVTPRQLRRLLGLALPFTRIEHRIEMSVTDVERARTLMSSRDRQSNVSKVGFLSR